MTLDIIDIIARSFLRSPYAESRKRLNPSIHAVGWNRSENQSTLQGAPDSRSQRQFRAAEAAEATPAPDDGLTRTAACEHWCGLAICHMGQKCRRAGSVASRGAS